jgi:quinol monooxygenase YgiN
LSEIHGIARRKIRPGKLHEFKRLAAKRMELARTKDTGTLRYDLVLNGDETECIAHEHDRDSESLLEYTQNLGDTMTAILATCTAAGELLGSPSPALRKALEGLPVRMFTPYLAM